MASLPEKLSQPALRALASVEIKVLADLQRFSEKEIKSLHGIGPNAFVLLKEKMLEANINFRSDQN